MKSFISWVEQRIEEKQSVLCVGLDSVPNKIPACLLSESDPQFAFNRRIIEVTHDLACCYKPNLAFYTVRGAAGMDTLAQTIQYAHSFDVPVVLDAKYGDIGHTADYYAQTVFDVLHADAVTVNPYMGEDTISPFRGYENKCVIVLCFTSNATRNDFQTKKVEEVEPESMYLYESVARKIVKWNTKGNLGAVVG
ncbi:orotidine-5'-phosphate decarboxylase, partial [bacterium]|nr:orotidine-5'-phosphate decarboxylase [bacterium]